MTPGRNLSRKGAAAAFAFSHAHTGFAPARTVTTRCRVVQAARVGFSGWRSAKQAPPTPRQKRRDTLAAAVAAAFTKDGRGHGSPRIHAELQDREISCDRETDAARAPGRVRVTDLTDALTGGGWLDRVAVFELFSREVVAHAEADPMHTGLAVEALGKAIARNRRATSAAPGAASASASGPRRHGGPAGPAEPSGERRSRRAERRPTESRDAAGSMAPGGGPGPGACREAAPPDDSPMTRSSRRSARPAHPGLSAFTLVEVLIVVVILGILAGLLMSLLRGKAQEAREVALDQQFQRIEQAIALFQQRTGRLPERLADLSTGDEEEADAAVPGETLVRLRETKDPWGNAFAYARGGGGGGAGEAYTLTSYGEDGEPGGEGEAADRTR